LCPASLEAVSDAHLAATPCDGEIIVGADGRLKYYNQSFAQLWSLHADELQNQPLWAEIAAYCIARDGHDAIWDIVSYATTVADPERLNDWGSVLRGNGKRISLAVSRLADGATRVIFTDNAIPSETPPTDTPSSDTPCSDTAALAA
jgi:PAS domain-containing protein